MASLVCLSKCCLPFPFTKRATYFGGVFLTEESRKHLEEETTEHDESEEDCKDAMLVLMKSWEVIGRRKGESVCLCLRVSRATY